MNVLFITLDQFRADCLSAAGHPLVKTPNLDALAAQGVRFARHYSQASPCGPGRAALYTGMYQMNNRVVTNGTPLDARFDNVARAARRAGYHPALFGYTDQSVDPREVTGAADPRLRYYTEVLPGFDPVLHIPDDHAPWLEWLRELGYDAGEAYVELAAEGLRPAKHSLSSFLTNHAIDWITQQDKPWFAHLSYLRPHPPYAAAGEFATMYAPSDVEMPITAAEQRHPFHDSVLRLGWVTAPKDEAGLRHMRAQYYGMISEVDAQLGRIWQTLKDLGQWEDTLIVVTADHGEQLGDHGLQQKIGYFEASYHVLGIVRDPSQPAGHGRVVNDFTENVDILPTICEAMSIPIPAQCDGRPLTPFLRGEQPNSWRDAAHWEFDWRSLLIRSSEPATSGWDGRMADNNLVALRNDRYQYVQFADGSWLCFDLLIDPTGRTEVNDPATVLALAQQMLVWRQQHTDRTLSDVLIDFGALGRLPEGVPAGVGRS